MAKSSNNINIKVYRLGPIAAFKINAHTIAHIIKSYYFAKYGIDSYIYLRNALKEKKEFFNFYGLEKIDNFFIKITSNNKTFSGIQNYYYLLNDLKKHKNFKKYVFLSKPKHVKILSKFKNLFNFKIIYENHTNHKNIEIIKLSDLTYTVSPEVYNEIKNFKNVIFWNYHYPVSEKFFLNYKKLEKKKNFIVGYIGSLLKEKGIGFLISSINSNELKNFKLKIIGGKPEEISNLKKEFNTERIIFTGYLPQNEIIKNLNDIDILIAPFTKKQATIPLKIYEYLATGIPVVSSDINAVKAVAKDYIYYYRPEDSQSLIKTLKFIMENIDVVNEKTKKARDYAEKFRWYNVIKQILKDLDNIDRIF